MKKIVIFAQFCEQLHLKLFNNANLHRAIRIVIRILNLDSNPILNPDPNQYHPQNSMINHMIWDTFRGKSCMQIR